MAKTCVDSINAETRFTLQEKVAQAMEMYNSGISLRAIGVDLGYAPRGAVRSARRLIERGLKEIISLEAEKMRAVEAMRYDAAQAAIWDKVLKGDYGAIDRFLAISDRRCKLFGLNQAQDTNVKQLVQQAVIVLPANERDSGETVISTATETETVPLLTG